MSKKYAPHANWYKHPLCWAVGHNTKTDRPGHSWIFCQRCGRNMSRSHLWLWWRTKSKLAFIFLWLANFVDNPFSKQLPNTPHHTPYFRPIDTVMPGIGDGKWDSGAYSYEGLKSLVEQDGPEGFGATMTVNWLLFDKSGIIEITDDNAEETIELINKDFALEATRQEQKKLKEEDENR